MILSFVSIMVCYCLAFGMAQITLARLEDIGGEHRWLKRSL